MKKNLLTKRRTTNFMLFFTFLLFNLFIVSAQNYCGATPVSIHGDLSVNGTKIVDQNGTPVSFAGNSFFWSNSGWGAEAFYNSNVVSWLKDDWNTTIVRAAMGVEDSGGYIGSPAANKQRVQTIVDAAIAEGLYVIIDWHSHHAEDNQASAISFFQEMATLYGNNPHVIYEIYNEPLQVSWSNTIKPYAEAVISAIRAIDPDNLIIVGTPTWSQDVDVASNDPITTSTNIAYTLHFYAATHKQSLRDKAQTAINNGIALFVTEWGTVSADGNGGVDATSTDEWMSFLAANDISHANWAMNNKNEGASSIVPNGSPNGGWSASDLTTSGTKVKSIIQNWQQYCTSGGNILPTVSISSPQNNSIASEGDVINIEVNASDFDGTVTGVEFFADATSLGTDSTSPYSFAWSPLEGNYTLTAVATDNDGDSSTSSSVNIDVFGPNGGTSAYPNGVPHVIPGTINAADFDIGGEDVAYNDTDSGNNGTGPRANENVDTGDYTGGGTVGWIAAGEWLNFTVDVATAGTYDIIFDVASDLNGSNFHLEFNGQDVTGQIGVSSTGGWGTYVSVEAQDVVLSAGLQTMRIAFDQGPFNLGNLYFTLDQPAGNQLPFVSITNPDDGANFIEGTTVSIEASASDNDGTITGVDFYVDGVLDTSDSTSPYTFNLPSTAIGTYTVYAVATDNDGDTTQSTSVDINIIPEPANVPPSVSVTNPSDGDDIIEGVTVSVGANASDSDGSVTGVDFYVDGILEASDSSAPYTFNWTSGTLGTHTIYAIATDDDGDTTQSASIDVDIIEEPANIPPSVSLSNPSNGDEFVDGTTVPMSATASDSDGTITSVSFYIDGVLTSSDSSAPYTFNWTSGTLGTHTIYAVATDDDGDTTQSTSIDIDVIEDSSGGCSFGAPQSAALASTNKSYNNVHVLGNGGPNLNNVTNFTINWDLQNNGLYQLSLSTNNGQPSWWNNLLGSASQDFNSSQPDITLSGTGFSGLDGNYWATLDGTNFALVSKTGGFTIYFSNSSTPPNCSSSRTAKEANNILTENSKGEIKMYPNPVVNDLIIDFGNSDFDSLSILDLSGRIIYSQKLKSKNINIPVNNFSKGTYIVKLSSKSQEIVKQFIKN